MALHEGSGVADASVDLLHIDGLHTYEAVREDFQTWRPKLAPDAVVLFHDVHPDRRYGSARYWKQLRRRHPHFEFMHDWGLGVLFPCGDKLRRAMCQSHFEHIAPLYEYKALYELSRIQVADLSEMATSRAEAIDQQSVMISERDAQIKRLGRDLAAARNLARKRLHAIDRQSKMIGQRDERGTQLAREAKTAHKLADPPNINTVIKWYSILF